jgi:hypothetical protein
MAVIPDTTDLSAVQSAPTAGVMDEMITALDAVAPKPPLTDYAAWIAEGVEAAVETRAAERRRASLMRTIYGDTAEVAA